MREKIQSFMSGRYGVDQLTRFLLMFDCALMMISFLVRSSALNFVCIGLIALCYFRIFSRNHTRRYNENQIYLKYYGMLFKYINRLKFNIKQSKDYHIYKCPNCRQKIRIPRGKGKISISCPKCQTSFIKRS